MDSGHFHVFLPNRVATSASSSNSSQQAPGGNLSLPQPMDSYERALAEPDSPENGQNAPQFRRGDRRIHQLWVLYRNNPARFTQEVGAWLTRPEDQTVQPPTTREPRQGPPFATNDPVPTGPAQSSPLARAPSEPPTMTSNQQPLVGGLAGGHERASTPVLENSQAQAPTEHLAMSAPQQVLAGAVPGAPENSQALARSIPPAQAPTEPLAVAPNRRTPVEPTPAAVTTPPRSQAQLRDGPEPLDDIRAPMFSALSEGGSPFRGTPGTRISTVSRGNTEGGLHVSVSDLAINDLSVDSLRRLEQHLVVTNPTSADLRRALVADKVRGLFRLKLHCARKRLGMELLPNKDDWASPELCPQEALLRLVRYMIQPDQPPISDLPGLTRTIRATSPLPTSFSGSLHSAFVSAWAQLDELLQRNVEQALQIPPRIWDSIVDFWCEQASAAGTPHILAEMATNFTLEFSKARNETDMLASLSIALEKTEEWANSHDTGPSKPSPKRRAESGASDGGNSNKRLRALCDRCGWFLTSKHTFENCWFRDHEHSNKEKVPWEQSKAAAYWKEKGLRSIPRSEAPTNAPPPAAPPANSTASSAPPAPTSEQSAGKPERREKKPHFKPQGKDFKSHKSKFARTLYQIIASNRTLGDDASFTCAIPISRGGETRHIKVATLGDTGCKRGDYMSPSLAKQLRAAGFPQYGCNLTVCSAFGQCQRCSGRFVFPCNITTDDGNTLTLPLSPYVLNLGEYDLVIGLETIRKYKLIDKLRSIFVDDESWYNPNPEEAIYDHVEPAQRKQQQPITVSEAYLKAVHSLKEQPGQIAAIVPKDKVLGRIPDGGWEEEFDNKNDLPAALCEAEAKSEGSSGDVPKEEELPVIQGSSRLCRLLRRLIRRFKHIFSRTVRKTPAKVKPMTFEIDQEKWNSVLKEKTVRRHSRLKTEEIRRQLKLMEELGVIERSDYPKYSQVLLAKKANGKWRFCIDFRALNWCMKSQRWPLPNIPQMIQRIGEKRPRFFAIMDTTSGYHQVDLHPDMRPYTAFITEFGQFVPTRVAFGIKTAPSYFQRMVASTVMKGLIHECMEMYIDDMLVYAQTEEEYLENLEKVFKRLDEYGITLNPDKCKFGLTSVEFVGHTIDKDGITFSPEKMRKVADFALPGTAKQLRSFLGLANYFHEHVDHYADLSQPLQELLNEATQNHRLTWTAEREEAFHTLKRTINQNQKLFFQSDGGRIVVETDASQYAIGAVCYQMVTIDGKEVRRPLRYFSQLLNPVQRRWNTTEKEAFAIVRALQDFEYLVRDTHFTLRTDHKNLAYLNTETPKVVRWKLAVQEFDFDLEYVQGELNVAADALSRVFQEGWHEELEAEAAIFGLSAQESSPELEVPSATIKDIPPIVLEVLQECHNPMVGHHGVERTLAKFDEHQRRGEIKEMYIRQHVTNFIKACPYCQKISCLKPAIRAARFTTSSYEPMARVSIDTIGPLPKADGGYEHILVVIDCFTRFVELYPLKTVTASEAAECLLDFMGRYGAPCQLVADNGKQFAADIIAAMARLTYTALDFILPYSKEENGIVERANREVLRHLRAFIFHANVQPIWKNCLPLVQRIMNATPHSATGLAPAELLFGQQVTLDRGIFHKDAFMRSRGDGSARTIREWVESLFLNQEKLILAAQETLRARDDFHLRGQKDEPSTHFRSGTFVLATYPKTAMGRQAPTKLHTHWRGPFRVTSNIGNEYQLQNLVTGKTELHHITSLREFNASLAGKATLDLRDIALRDSGEFVVEKIIRHEGDPNEREEMDFLVKWEGLSDQFNLWLPYREVRELAQFDDYVNSTEELKPLRAKRQKTSRKTHLQEVAGAQRMETRSLKRLQYDLPLQPPRRIQEVVRFPRSLRQRQSNSAVKAANTVAWQEFIADKPKPGQEKGPSSTKSRRSIFSLSATMSAEEEELEELFAWHRGQSSIRL